MSRLGALHVTQATGAKHSGTVIFFHGSGGTGDTMKQWVQMMAPFSFPHLRVIFPTAPLQPYTPMGGDMSNVWFDRLGIAPHFPEHEDSLSDIAVQVKQLIKQENDLGISTNHIIVGGFSMGGALALHTAYRWERKVAGVFAFSSFLNKESGVYRDLKSLENDNTPPLLQIHGDNDDLVLEMWGKDTYDQLKQLGVKGDLHILNRLGHSLNKKGLNIIRSWIEKTLPQESDA